MAEIERAELYGMLLFCRKFSPEEIYLRTESACAAQRMCRLAASYAGAVGEIRQTLTARKGGTSIYRAGIPLSNDCERLFDMFGHDAQSVSMRINMANIEFEPCAAAFLRGAFLSCGSMTDPESEYRLEFASAHKNLSDDLCRVIKETTELASGRAASVRVVSRRSSCVVYLKDSEDISDMLTLMGASNASMTVMQVKIEKSRENLLNRKINSQIANTDKTVSAAAKQMRAIKALEESGTLKTLGEELRDAARLRSDHPTSSLKELAQLSGGVSRSGLNHRLNKLVELANEEIGEK